MARRIALVLPSATYRAADFLTAARAVDADVVIASEGHQAMAEELGPGFIHINLSRPQEAARQINSAGPFDAVVAVDDAGVTIAAEAAGLLGLSHNSPSAVAATRDKAAMRKLLAMAGVPQPRFEVVGPSDDVEGAVKRVGTPAVLKPTSLAGGRGVIRVDTVSDAPAVADRIRAICEADAGSTTILVEEFVPGAEVAVEGLLSGGALQPLALFDKPGQGEGPYFEETMLVTPSRLPEDAQDRIFAVAARAAAAIGLVEGPAHIELKAAPGGPILIELAARPIGGLCSRALSFGLLGASLETLLLRHALRLPQGGLDRRVPASGVLMLPIPMAGTFQGIGGRDEALATPGVTGLEVTTPTGEWVVPLPEGDRYLGFLFARSTSPAGVEAALGAAYAKLEVQISRPRQDGSVSSAG